MIIDKQHLYTSFWKYKYLILVLLFFGLVYSLISLVNHYFFRTYALDLGLYTNALYDYSHFQWNDSCVFKNVSENLLSDHFDLYLIIFSPLSYIFGTYTLLIVQIASVLLGGLGVYKYFSLSHQNKLPLWASIYFLMFFGIYSALSYDYHSNVVAAMVVPWFFYAFKQKRYFLSSALFVFFLIGKENISLWAVFICLGMLFEYRKDKKSLIYLGSYALFAALYFVLITFYVMPAISNDGTYPHLNYAVLGNSSVQALTFLVSHPLESIRLLFVNHSGDPGFDYIKMEFHLMALGSGLFLLFFRPQYLIMLIPIYFQKMYHDFSILWGIDAQYSIELAPILAIGVFSFIGSLKKKWLSYLIIGIALTGALSATVRLMDNTKMFTDKSRIRFYKSIHYRRNYNVKLIYEKLNAIPKQAVVCTQGTFLPHLALRDNIYLFPAVKDAQYIIYSEKEDTWPLSKEDFDATMDKVMQSREWAVDFKNEDIVVLRRIVNNQQFRKE
ncbi:MAG: DUF2079 domain-containing protein [Bacteroidota bacterium]